MRDELAPRSGMPDVVPQNVRHGGKADTIVLTRYDASGDGIVADKAGSGAGRSAG